MEHILWWIILIVFIQYRKCVMIPLQSSWTSIKELSKCAMTMVFHCHRGCYYFKAWLIQWKDEVELIKMTEHLAICSSAGLNLSSAWGELDTTVNISSQNPSHWSAKLIQHAQWPGGVWVPLCIGPWCTLGPAKYQERHWWHTQAGP